MPLSALLIRRAFGVLVVLSLIFASTVDAGRFCSTSEGTFCVTATDAGNGFATITVTITKPGLSWAAFGISPNAQMPGSDVYIAWPSGSNVILSDRKTTGRVMPQADAVQNSELQTGSSYNAATGLLTAVFRRRYTTGDPNDEDLKQGAQNYILAYRTGTPPEANPGATIAKHSFTDVIRGANLVDFTPSGAGGAAPAPTTPAPSPAGTRPPTAGAPTVVAPPPASQAPSAAASIEAQDPLNIYIRIHGYLMFTAWGVLAPLGIVIASYSRGKPFFYIHWYILWTVVATTLGAFALAVYYEQAQGNKHFDPKVPHTVIGVVVSALAPFQAFLGLYIHTKGYSPPRPIRNWSHMWLGRLIFLTALTNLVLGHLQYIELYSTSRVILYIFAGAAAVYILALIVGFDLWLGRFKKEWYAKKFGEDAPETYGLIDISGLRGPKYDRVA